MRGKKGIELPWIVLIPLIILAGLLVIYLLFSGTAARTLGNAIEFLKNTFRFGG